MAYRSLGEGDEHVEQNATYPLGEADTQNASQIQPLEVIEVNDETTYLNILSDTRDKLIVVNFAAHWCPGARAFVPTFKRLAQKYSINGDALFMLVPQNKRGDNAWRDHYTKTSWVPEHHFIKNGNLLHYFVDDEEGRMEGWIRKLLYNEAFVDHKPQVPQSQAPTIIVVQQPAANIQVGAQCAHHGCQAIARVRCNGCTRGFCCLHLTRYKRCFQRDTYCDACLRSARCKYLRMKCVLVIAVLVIALVGASTESNSSE
eukprot:464244_1